MFKEQNFCHIASNNRNNVKVGVFVYRTSDNLATVTVSGYFNERIIDINLHDIIIHEKIDPVDSTVVQRNTLCVVKRTVDNVETKEIHSAWEELTDQAIQNIQNALANIALNDLTDVNINNVQVGEYLRWNGTKWINMAGGGGGSAVWGSVGGDIADQADLQAALAGKADVTDLAGKADVDLDNLSATGEARFDAKANVDMDNLTDTGANIANWSHNVTNCITKIPQDINLEGASSTVRIKDGSKIYIPDGFESDNVTLKFNEVTLSNDKVALGLSSYPFLVFYNSGADSGLMANISSCFSGPTAPTIYPDMIWYDTTNNLIKRTNDYGSTWTTTGISLPVGAGKYDSEYKITNVFNGFGYIGSTVFALPGVKGLIPNGRNTDGTLKNTETTVSSVLTKTSNNSVNNVTCFLTSSGIDFWDNASFDYDTKTNSFVWLATGANYYDRCGFARCKLTSGAVSEFTSKTAFQAHDYNNTEHIAHQAMPGYNYITLTLGASGTSYAAPADGYFVCRIAPATNNRSHLSFAGAFSVTYKSYNDGNYLNGFVPVAKRQIVQVTYLNKVTDTGEFLRFYYAIGTK